MAELDTTNIEILRALKDGRIPFREIATGIGVSENTVRTRVAKLQRDGILDISGYVNPERIDEVQLIYVGVKLDTMKLSQVAEELSKLRGVVASAVITGRYDIMLTVALSETFTLLDFYTEEISRVSNIASVETFVVYQSYNVRIPMPH